MALTAGPVWAGTWLSAASALKGQSDVIAVQAVAGPKGRETMQEYRTRCWVTTDARGFGYFKC
jgi:hypothetical protein